MVATEIKDPKAVDKFVSQVAKDWKSAKQNSVDHTLCVFAQKLTLTTEKMLETDVKNLLNLGLSQILVHDAVQVISYLNNFTRIADALNVDMERYVIDWEK